MNKASVICVFLLISIQGFAKCGFDGLQFFPKKSSISENSVFVIEGYGTSQKAIHEFGTTGYAYLKSGMQKIKLIVQEIHVGQHDLTQAILKPEMPLSIGHEYQLIIDNAEIQGHLLSRYNTSTNQAEKIKWKVEGKGDYTPPSWTSKPEFQSSSYKQYGCGPAVFATFAFEANDHSEFLVKTVLKNLTNGKEATYYLPVENNAIQVGHRMCSGAFKFGDGDKFEVEFSLFDASGNLTQWLDKRIEFEKPKRPEI